MLKFTIGKKDYELEGDALPFARLKRLWPLVKDQIDKKAPDAADVGAMVEFGFEQIDKTCAILSVILKPKFADLTAEFIEENILPNEINGNAALVQELLIESGLIKTGPQASPPAANQESRSAETSTDSSLSSSSTAAKEGAGT